MIPQNYYNYILLFLVLLFNLEYAIAKSNEIDLEDEDIKKNQLLEISLINSEKIIIQFIAKTKTGIQGFKISRDKKNIIVTDEIIEINYHDIKSYEKISKGMSKKAIASFIALGVATLLFMIAMQESTIINME